MIVATANVKKTLSDADAKRTLDRTLRFGPDLIALPEWESDWRGMLPDTYQWTRGIPVGVRDGMGRLLAARTFNLSPSRDDVRASRATEVLFAVGERLNVALAVHLLAHHNRPVNYALWMISKRRVERWAREWKEYRPMVRLWVMGDVNKHDLQFDGLISCWQGRDPGATFKGRTIDGVWAWQKANRVWTVRTPSDHNSVVAEY